MATDWEADLERAEAQLQEGNLDGAESAFGVISAHCPPALSEVVAHAQLGWGEAIYRRDGRERESLDHFRLAVKLGGVSQTAALAWLSIGGVHRMFREIEETHSAYERSAAIFHQLADPYGEFLAEDGLQECLRSLRRGEEAAPHLARAAECAFLAGEVEVGSDRTLDLGELALTLGRTHQALAAFTMVAEVSEKTGDLRREMKARLQMMMRSDDPDVLARLPELGAKLAALEGDEELARVSNWLRERVSPQGASDDASQ